MQWSPIPEQFDARQRWGGQISETYKLKISAPSFVFTFTEIHMKKRSDKNSKTSAEAEFACATDDAILPPADVELRTEKEYLIWRHFTRACAKEDW